MPVVANSHHRPRQAIGGHGGLRQNLPRHGRRGPGGGVRDVDTGVPAGQRGLRLLPRFWGEVNKTKLEEISADPSSLTVEYTYKYSKKGEGSAEDDVILQLQFTDGTYLIAGES